MDISRLHPYRWNLVFELLSLDCVVPLYAQMGLVIEDERRLVHVLRSLISDKRKTYAHFDNADLSFASQVLRDIEREFGERIARHFYEWSTTVFCWVFSDQPQWSAWESILRSDFSRLPKRLTVEQYDEIARLRESLSIQETKKEVASLRSEALSEWDAERFSIQDFNSKEERSEDDDSIDPYEPILTTVGINRLQIAWSDFWSNFSQDEKALLLTYGNRFLKEIWLDQLMPEPLSHPDVLQRRL